MSSKTSTPTPPPSSSPAVPPPLVVPPPTGGLHAAALKGEVARLCTAMPPGAKKELVDAQDSNGRTCLHYAVISGIHATITALLDRGSDVTLLDSSGCSRELFLVTHTKKPPHATIFPLSPKALHYAAQSGDLDLVKLLVKHAAKTAAEKMKSAPPMCLAALKGRTKLFDALLPVTPQPADSQSALMHYAAAGGSVAFAESLTKRVSAAVDAKDGAGQTPLHVACSAGNGAMAAFLLTAGANAATVDGAGWTAVHHAAAGDLADVIRSVAAKAPAAVNAVDPRKRTPAHVAAAYGSSNALRALLDCGAAAAPRDSAGVTPLHNACYRGHHACAAMLSSGQPRQESEVADAAGLTPLHMAAFGGHSDLCAMLLARKGADANVRARDGTTPLHLACHRGDLKTIQVLLDCGAKVDAADVAGATPMYNAAFGGHRKAVCALARARANVSAPDGQGNGPIAVAVSRGNLSVVQQLLKLGANPEAQNKLGENALHIAGRIGATEAVNAIMSHLWNLQTQYYLSGDKDAPRPPVPNPNAQDKKGRTALHLAVTNRHPETAKALTLKGCDPVGVKDGAGKTAAELAVAGGLFTQQEVDQLNKQRVAAARARDKDSPEYQARLKEVLGRAMALFGNKPMSGIEHMQSSGLLGPDASDIAEFLHETPELNKTKIGELVGGPSDLQKAILKEFVGMMDFAGLEFEMALRRFLTTFRLPGEAQVIDRIMQAFANHFFEQNSGSVFANADAVYILAFSTIMLNTDAHSVKVKDKMTKAQWLRTNRKINNGQDFPAAFLESLYERIVDDEIKMEQGVFTNAEKKGWLTKQGGRIKTWKRRWFILSETCLYYFKTPQDKEPCGIISLDNVEVLRNKGKKNSFLIKCWVDPDAPAPSSSPSGATGAMASPGAMKDGKPLAVANKLKGAKMDSSGGLVQAHHEVYLLTAESKSDMESWLTAINSSIHHNPFYALMEQRTTGGGASADQPNAPQQKQAIKLRLERPAF